MNTVIVMLAAGSARRFGSDKRVALLPGNAKLLEQAVGNALASQLPVIVCLRPGDTALAKQMNQAGARALTCPHASLGMGSTLADATLACNQYEGVLVALGDMPHILPATFRQLAERLTPQTICQPRWQGRPGHPVGFGKDFFPALSRLKGEPGARSLVRQNDAALHTVPVTDPGIILDIDRPADIQPQ